MFFAGISGSSTADVAVLSRTVAVEMTREGYDRAFTAALIACASTMANLIPPSIMAVVYGATGNVSIGGLFLAGIVPGVLIGIGLMIYSHFFGPVGILKPRASLCEFADAARASALPLMIPLIIMGGILTGWFTPTEAGMIASVYIIVVMIPLLNRGHVTKLPRDFVYTGLLYSLPLALVAAASAFGWMLAYLRGPDIVSGWIESFAGHDGCIIMLLLVLLFVVIGDFMDAVPAIIIFMPIVNKLTELGDIKLAAHGRGGHHHAGVRPDHAALRVIVAGGVEIHRGAFQHVRCMPRCRSMLCSSSPSRSRCCSRKSCSICRSCCFRSRSAASRARPARDTSVRPRTASAHSRASGNPVLSLLALGPRFRGDERTVLAQGRSCAAINPPLRETPVAFGFQPS